jgi:dipeptidyl aminopeptidase/acylaminoacyl peptidase
MSRLMSDLAQEELFGTQMEFYRESPDGRYSFWRDSHNRFYYLEDKLKGTTTRLEQLSSDNLPIDFTLSDTGLYFSRYRTNNRYLVYFLDFTTFEIQEAMTLDGTYSSQFSLSADQRYFLLSSMGRGDMDIAEISLEQQKL